MFDKIATPAVRLGALLLAAALVIVGCDVLGDTKSDKPLLEVTNDLAERMTVFHGKTVPVTRPKSAPAKSAFTLRAVSRIDPPNSGQSASHISKTASSASDQSIFVAYKVPGATFGGGIDILDASDPTDLDNEDNALRTNLLDVQEVLYDGAGTAPFNLYIAGAVDFGKIAARDYGNTPAVMLRARIDADGNVVTNPDGDVQVVEAAMPNRVVKGLALAPYAARSGSPTSQPHDNAAIYAVTDSSVLYSFDSGLGLRNATSINDDDVELMSVTSQQDDIAPINGDHVYALGSEGEIHKFVNNATPYSGPTLTFSDLTEGGIARLSTHVHRSTAGNISSDLQVMYAALNDGGFAVLSQVGDEVFYENTDNYYVSVVGADHDVDGSGDVARVFAAGPNGTIDVFEIVPGKLDDGDPTTGLQLLGSFDLGGIEENGIGSGSLGSGQINQIVVEDDYLFVAAGDEGVVVLEIAENEGDIFQ